MWSTRSNSIKSGSGRSRTGMVYNRPLGNFVSHGDEGRLDPVKVKTYRREVAPRILEREPRARSIQAYCGFEPDRDIAFFAESAARKEEYRNSLRATGHAYGKQNGLRLSNSIPGQYRSSTSWDWNFPGALTTDFWLRKTQQSKSAPFLGSLINQSAPGALQTRAQFAL
eukprot:gnl/MRDRNA2_/MRDRNA2_113266_c0_seq1.p1 gnl/MRDRNA2_/MRDRNA2_113266_c0~~gnl/MRDRNA2_/MRDRNA2_113266_c0_seq1.p1  ORF type:complete len:169 (+),score=14.68 gnl/MRDRNA2_/MRDRNA2_113266_c0_seq1:87-593(+)